jgi:hypothetical protein
MQTLFKKYETNKNRRSRWFGRLGTLLAVGAFSLFFSTAGLAGPPVPLPPHPPLPPLPPPPHQVLPHPPIVAPPHLPPGPPDVIHRRTGRPPHPGWVWVPGFYRGRHWVEGHWDKPRQYRPRYDHGPRYHPGPPPHPRNRPHPGPPPHGRFR